MQILQVFWGTIKQKKAIKLLPMKIMETDCFNTESWLEIFYFFKA